MCIRDSITTDVPGCNEVVEHNFTGIIIPSKDSNSLVEAILYLVNNTKERKQMGKNAFEKAKKEFEENILIEKQLQIYKELSS